MSKRIKHPKGKEAPASLYVGCLVIFKCQRTNGKWVRGIVAEMTKTLVGISIEHKWAYYAVRIRPSKFNGDISGLVIRRVE